MPKAVIISADEFESWMETLEVNREFPDLKKDIQRFKKDVKIGKHLKYHTFQEVAGNV
ncbi:MAG: hypothetical protein HY602_00450 [Parcubacteria group bacterium]|nr:hypothetical protein [Parcubacteria group bacterium]